MRKKPVAKPVAKPPVNDRHKGIVAYLRDLLKRAKEGKIDQFAFATVSGESHDRHGFIYSGPIVEKDGKEFVVPVGHAERLVGQLGIAHARLAGRIGMLHDDVDPETLFEDGKKPRQAKR